MKEILFVDMDNVLADFAGYVEHKLSPRIRDSYTDPDGRERLDEIPGIFAQFEPVEGALEAMETLKDRYDLYVLSTSPWNNPTALQDKLNWLKLYFGDLFYKRVIFSHHKNLCIQPGAWLVDDRPAHGAADFGDRWISFGPNGRYKNWTEVTRFLMGRGQ